MFSVVKTYLFYFLILVYVSGAIGFFIAPEFFLGFTPLTLLLTFFVFAIHQPYNNKTYMLLLSGIALFTLGIELIGVHTGKIFGTYVYGESLGPKFFGVPIIIAFNWALLINAVVLTASRLQQSRWLTALLSALIIVVFDVLMEQVAPLMDMWYFAGGLAGTQNYVAWFLITCLMAYVFQEPLKRGNRSLALIVLILQFFVFVSVYFAQLYTKSS